MKGIDILGAINLKSLNTTVITPPRPPVATMTTAIKPPPPPSGAGLASAITATTRPPASGAGLASAITASGTPKAAAAPAPPPPSAQSVSKAGSSASNLMSVAKRVASKFPKRALGKTAQTAANNSLARIKKIQTAQSHMMGVLGVDWGKVGTTALDPSAWLATQAGTDDAFAAMVEAGGNAYALIDKLTAASLQSQADQGNAIADAMNNLLTSANATLDPTGAAYAGGAGAQFGSQAFALLQKENYWETAANAALQGAPPPPTSTTNTTTTTTTPNPNAPTIATVVDNMTGTPNTGNPGDQVTITGTNLTGATAVTFGGAPAQFVINSPTQITATIPPNPAPGYVTVTTPNGTAQSSQTFTLSSAMNYGDAGNYGGGGGGYGGGGGGSFDSGGGFDSGGADQSGDDQALQDMADAEQGGGGGGDDGSGGYEFSQDTLDRSYGGYGSSVDQSADYAPMLAMPMPRQQSAPQPQVQTPVNVAAWANKDAYSKGDVVSYKSNYYRATKDVSSRWLFSNDAPDSSDAWAKMTPKTTTAQAQTDDSVVGDAMSQAMTTPSSGTDWGALAVDPTGISYAMYKVFGPQWEREAYQPRYVNTYWQNRAQSPIAAATGSRLQLAQQLQGSLQSQLAARYAALAAQVAQPQIMGEYGMSKKIVGPALCGFADYFLPTSQTSLIGLAPVIQRGALAKLTSLVTHVPQKGSLSHGVTVKMSPGGNPISSLHINNKVLQRRSPEAVQHAAQLAAQHAQTVAKNVLNAVAHVATVQKKTGTKPTPVVHGIGAALKRPPSPAHVPPQSLTQLKSQAQALQKAAGKLTDAAKTYKKQTDNAKSKQGAAISHQKTVTKLHGDAIVGATVDPQTGLWMNPATGQDYPTDPSTGQQYDSATGAYIDPNTGMPSSGASGTTTDGTSTSAVSQTAGPPDYGAGATPTPQTALPQVDIDYTSSSELGPNEAAQFYTSDPSGTLPDGSLATLVPMGAVYFDGSRPLPFKSVGNYTVFYGTLPGASDPKGGPGSGHSWHGSGGFDWALELMGSGGGYSGNHNFDKVGNPGLDMISESEKNGWGNLVGNPQDPMMNGARFDVAKLAFFWPYDLAPDWARASINAQVYNAAMVAWKAAQTAGQADYVAAQLSDKLDAQTAAANTRQQAQQDIGLAMQQQQFDQQQSQQSSALDLQSQQDAEAMSMQQAQLDAQQQAMDMQTQQQQAASDVAAQQMQDQFYYAQQQQAMQQQAMAPQQYADQGGGAVDDGSGGGAVDDGSGGVVDDGSSPEGASDAEAAAIDAGDSLVGLGINWGGVFHPTLRHLPPHAGGAAFDPRAAGYTPTPGAPSPVSAPAGSGPNAPTAGPASPQAIAALKVYNQQRGVIIAQAVSQGEIDLPTAGVFQQGMAQLAQMIQQAQQQRFVDWTAFWQNLPPLGTNLGGAFGQSLNANAQQIVTLVSQLRHPAMTQARNTALMGDSLVGAGGAANIDAFIRDRQRQDEGAIDGAGNVIGIDDYGNTTD